MAISLCITIHVVSRQKCHNVSYDDCCSNCAYSPKECLEEDNQPRTSAPTARIITRPSGPHEPSHLWWGDILRVPPTSWWPGYSLDGTITYTHSHRCSKTTFSQKFIRDLSKKECIHFKIISLLDMGLLDGTGSW